jgi:nucleotide-binding universal stress UspA family protein
MQENDGPAAKDDSERKRFRLPPGTLVTLLLAAALCGVAFLLNLLAQAGLFAQMGTPAGLNGVDATLYLKSLPWEKKSHEALRPLEKMKNLRYALDFFEKYSPEAIATVQAIPSGIPEALQGYGDIAGRIVAIRAKVAQKYAVSEDIEIRPGAPSTLLSLEAEEIDASLLVMGSTLDGINAGDDISFRCLPLYCYAPKEGSGALLFITIPELIDQA